MATTGKRITRKQLREPDWFQTTSDNALDYFNHHKTLVFAAVGAVIVIAAIAWGWQLFKQRQNVAASAQFSKAMAHYQSERYRDAIPAFEAVKDYRWSHYAVLAHLYLANSYLQINDVDKALSEAQRSLAATSPNSLYRQIALVTLGTAEEQKKQCKSALEHYAEAQNISGPLQSRAVLGRARCAEELGEINAAIAAYKEYVKDNPGSPWAIKAAELEAKAPTAAAKSK